MGFLGDEAGSPVEWREYSVASQGIPVKTMINQRFKGFLTSDVLSSPLHASANLPTGTVGSATVYGLVRIA